VAGKKSKDRVSEQTARARKELALAEKYERENRRADGELIESSEVVNGWASRGSVIQSALMAAPVGWAEDVALAVGGDQRVIYPVLLAGVERLLRQLSREISNLASSDPTSDTGTGCRADATTAAEPSPVGRAELPIVQ
jgi:phage terminase Nu1 subunit (DNA packaging protein)